MQRARTKFGSRATWSALCQRRFASAAEARRGEELTLLERAGRIRELVCQPEPYVLCRTPRVSYRADFAYVEGADDQQVVEDVKGLLTREARVKLAWLAERGLLVRLLRSVGPGWHVHTIASAAPRGARGTRTGARPRESGGKRRARMP